LADLPTLDRRFTDLARLTPQIANRDGDDGLGVSVVGQNNRYNTIQIDGTTVNDRFGLGRTGTSGGQANGKPIGYDAVKEYQVELAPYDVRLGNFTGALINAITKTGSNDWQVSAFGFFRNQNLAGDPLKETEFKRWQLGGNISGPIKRDKANFFLNGEFQRSDVPGDGPYIGAPSDVSGVRPNQTDVDAFNAVLGTYGLEGGNADLVTNSNPLNNFTGRVDWGLSAGSRIVFRYTYNEAADDVFNRESSTSNPTWNLSTYGYQFRNKTHNPSFQWFKNMTNGSSNEFRLSYNRIRDERDPFVAQPAVRVRNFTDALGNSYRLRAGSEQFSQGNRLSQDIYELTDNFSFAPKGDHSFTIGTRNEFYKVTNLFAQSSFGVWDWNDLAEFAGSNSSSTGGLAARSYTVSGNPSGGDVTPAVFSSAVIGLYAQDQWNLSPKFSMTLGLRADIPVFFDQPEYAAQVNTDFDNPQVPSGQVLFNPRAGFNWDIDGLGNQQLRGGAGIFTGSPAFVWMSNAYSNSGTNFSILDCGTTNPNGFAPGFQADPANQTKNCVDPTGAATTSIGSGGFLGEVDLIAGDTRFPQVFRTNLAYDRRLPGDVILTLEGIYSKGVNDYFIVNRNLSTARSAGGSPSDQTGDGVVGTDANGRTMYGTLAPDGQALPQYFDNSVYGTGSSGVFELRNTSSNYSVNATVGLRKAFGRSFNVTAAYTWSQAKDVQSFTSSRATSNWRFGRTNSGDQFTDDATISNFDRPNKLTFAGTYVFPWESYTTQISLIYIAQSGQPYTYIAGSGVNGDGDLNADGTNANDPIYIQRSATDQNISYTNSADATAFDAFISGESCLDKQRGTIMQRNSCRNPFQHFMDANIRQALPIGGKNRLSLDIGFFNVLNLFNSDWGLIKTVGGTTNFTDAILAVDDAPTGTPNFSFNEPQERFVTNGQSRNSWQVQFSLRYDFSGAGVF
jgi:hypothetical protein